MCIWDGLIVFQSVNVHGGRATSFSSSKIARPADILFQCSDNTWQVYNRWPDDYSLYTDPRHPWAPDVSVSFDRPYGKIAQIFDNPQTVGSGEFLAWEFPFVYWLESNGYDVTYCSNSDMLDPKQPLRAKVLLSVGHDEYWDPRQYETALAAVKAGVTQLYLCGTQCSAWLLFRNRTMGGQIESSAERAGSAARRRRKWRSSSSIPFL